MSQSNFDRFINSIPGLPKASDLSPVAPTGRTEEEPELPPTVRRAADTFAKKIGDALGAEGALRLVLSMLPPEDLLKFCIQSQNRMVIQITKELNALKAGLDQLENWQLEESRGMPSPDLDQLLKILLPPKRDPNSF